METRAGNNLKSKDGDFKKRRKKLRAQTKVGGI